MSITVDWELIDAIAFLNAQYALGTVKIKVVQFKSGV
jgi:hypothetical protein